MQLTRQNVITSAATDDTHALCFIFGFTQQCEISKRQAQLDFVASILGIDHTSDALEVEIDDIRTTANTDESNKPPVDPADSAAARGISNEVELWREVAKPLKKRRESNRIMTGAVPSDAERFPSICSTLN
jgi:hypothetical protein